MKFIGRKFFIGLLAAGTAAVACSTATHPTQTVSPSTTQNAEPGTVGALGASLTLPGGEHFSSVSYELANTLNGGSVDMKGNYNISSTTALSFTVGTVPSGSGYELAVTMTSDDKAITCSYPTPGFYTAPTVANTHNTTNLTIANRTTTAITLNLECVVNQGLDAGSLLASFESTNCPVWNTIVANPINITLDAGQNVNDAGTAGSTAFFPGTTPVPAVINDGQQLVLVGAATAPNPGALTFNWTASGGTLSSAGGTTDPNSSDAGTTNQTIFTCPSAPTPTATYTITLSLGDGQDSGGGCSSAYTTGTVQVTCSNPAPCGGAPFATVQTYNSGECTGNGNMSVNDPKGFPYVPGAVDPNNAGDFCCVGACGDGTIGGSAATLATTFPSGTGGCTSPLVNNGQGCCVPVLPCTTPGQTNCVACDGNTNGVCTPTESLIVQRDIGNSKFVTTTGGSGLAPTPFSTTGGSCYECLNHFLCIDNSSNTGTECGDLPSGATTFDKEAPAQACTDLLSCIITNKCTTANPPAQCFCGTAAGSACLGAGAANGPCLQQEINGLGVGSCSNTFPAPLMCTEGDPTNSQKAFTNANVPSGMANDLMGCAFSNCQAQCTP